MTDRLTCTDEELDRIQKLELKCFYESIGIWTDPVKTDAYWRLTDQHREEWTARIASRKKLEKAAEKAAEVEQGEAA